MNSYDGARLLLPHGRTLTLLKPESKEPAFTNWPRRRLTDAVICDLTMNHDYEIAEVTGEVVVADLDTPEAMEWVKCRGIASPEVARSGRGGIHLSFRSGGGVGNRVALHGIKGLDIRGEGGLIVRPFSLHPNGNRYEWISGPVPVEDLPEFPVALLEPTCKIVRPAVHNSLTLPDEERVRRVRKGLSRIYSIEHHGGDLALFKAACWVVQKMGITDCDIAFEILWDWNTDGEHCRPPWNEERVRYKIREALRLR